MAARRSVRPSAARSMRGSVAESEPEMRTGVDHRVRPACLFVVTERLSTVPLQHVES